MPHAVCARVHSILYIAKMDDNLDIDKFCSLIKAKDSIWNYKSEEYGIKQQRRDDWILVAQEMVPGFEEKKNGEKCTIVSELQIKWKVLRDGFTRSLKNYKANKGKLYVHFEQLCFLYDLYDDQDADILNSISSAHAKQEKPRIGRRRPRKICASEKSGDESDEQPVQKTARVASPAQEPSTSTDTGLDHDQHFLMSLLKDFKKIPEDQKLDAKGDIINVIRHYRNVPSQYETRGSYFSNDIAALATTAIGRPLSPRSTEHSRSNSPVESKYDALA